MNLDRASAVTWSMTSGGAKPFRVRIFDKKCPCGSRFIPTHGLQRYCGPECKPKGATYPHTCQQCGDPFKSWHKTAKFCSVVCKHKAKSYGYTRDCSVCGDPFTTPRSQRKRRTCSDACAAKLRAEVGHRSVYPHGVKKTVDMLEFSPENRCKLTAYFRGMPIDQLDRVWVSSVLYHFCEGRRGELAEVLGVIRDRYRLESGTAHPQAVE